MRPKSARKVKIERRIVDAVRRARERHMREFRAIYLTAKDRRALGLDVAEVDGIPIRDGQRSAIYGTSGTKVAI